jgi:hypothetical protein
VGYLLVFCGASGGQNATGCRAVPAAEQVKELVRLL